MRIILHADDDKDGIHEKEQHTMREIAMQLPKQQLDHVVDKQHNNKPKQQQDNIKNKAIVSE